MNTTRIICNDITFTDGMKDFVLHFTEESLNLEKNIWTEDKTYLLKFPMAMVIKTKDVKTGKTTEKKIKAFRNGNFSVTARNEAIAKALHKFHPRALKGVLPLVQIAGSISSTGNLVMLHNLTLFSRAAKALVKAVEVFNKSIKDETKIEQEEAAYITYISILNQFYHFV